MVSFGFQVGILSSVRFGVRRFWFSSEINLHSVKGLIDLIFRNAEG